MGNFLNAETGQLNPSMGRIARACGLSEVQARRQVHELIGMGLLSVVGNHDGGSSGSSRQYRLHLDRLPVTPLIGDSPSPLAHETPLTGDRALAGDRDPSHGRSAPLSPVIDTPLTGETLIKKESGKNKEGNQEARKRPAQFPCPADVDQQTWSDYLIVRKAKKAPMTATALTLLQNEAGKAGITLQEAVSMCCARSWTSLRADWLHANGGGRGQQQRRGQQSDFDQTAYGEAGDIHAT